MRERDNEKYVTGTVSYLYICGKYIICITFSICNYLIILIICIILSVLTFVII